MRHSNRLKKHRFSHDFIYPQHKVINLQHVYLLLITLLFVAILYHNFYPMADLTNAQKKEWAKTLYLRENLTQQEIADRVGVSRVTVSNWVRAGKWEEQKVGMTLTRQQQISNLYRQVAEINRAISERPDGERFANTKEADILGKLAAAIAKMEQEVGIADIISVLTDMINWLRKHDLEKAKELTQWADAFIKDKL